MPVANAMPAMAPNAKANDACLGTDLSLATTNPSTSVSGLKRMASASVAMTARCVPTVGDYAPFVLTSGGR
jgi:hypothetical protein